MVAHAIAVAPNADDVTMVHEAIDQCARHDVRQHRRRVLVASAHELEEAPGAESADGHVADFIDHRETRWVSVLRRCAGRPAAWASSSDVTRSAKVL